MATPRVRLTLPIIGYGLVNILGMLLLAVGGAHLARGPGVFFANVPSTTGEAVVYTLLGVGLMYFAGTRLLRETMKQAERLAAEIDAGREHH
jgi:hypothetical protein